MITISMKERILDLPVPKDGTITAPYMWWRTADGEMSKPVNISIELKKGDTLRKGIQNIEKVYHDLVGDGEARHYYAEDFSLPENPELFDFNLFLGT